MMLLPMFSANSRSAAGLILLAVLLAWWNSFSGTYQFDDYKVIVDNPSVVSLSAWWHSMPGIRPLLKLSYTLNQIISQPYRLAGFHAVNLALHAGNALLLLAVLRQLLPDHARTAWLAALLFAVHPAYTEAVTLISGRSMALMALFYLASILCHLQSRRIGSCAAFLAALTVRETALTLPLALLLIDHQRSVPIRTALHQSRSHWLLLACAISAFALLPQYRHLAEVSLATRASGDNLVTQSFAVLYLARQWLWPFALNADPLLPVFSQWHSFWLGTSALCIMFLGAGICLWWRQGRWRWAGFAIVWYALHLAPGNSFLPRLDIASERHLYLATIGFCLLLAMGLDRAITRWPRAGLLASVILVGTLGIGTHLRNHVYFSETTFWQDVIHKSPANSRAWNNLGYALARQGDIAAAWNAYRQASWLQPGDYTAKLNLGALCRDHAEKIPKQCAPK